MHALACVVQGSALSCRRAQYVRKGESTDGEPLEEIRCKDYFGAVKLCCSNARVVPIINGEGERGRGERGERGERGGEFGVVLPCATCEALQVFF